MNILLQLILIGIASWVLLVIAFTVGLKLTISIKRKLKQKRFTKAVRSVRI